MTSRENPFTYRANCMYYSSSHSPSPHEQPEVYIIYLCFNCCLSFNCCMIINESSFSSYPLKFLILVLAVLLILLLIFVKPVNV